MPKIIVGIVLAMGIALSGFFVAYGVVESRKTMRSVQVKGLAERIVKSDQAIWTLNFKLVNNELPALYKDLSQAQQKIMQFLKQRGFDAKEVNVNPITLTDNQSVNYNQNQNLPRYSADSGISVATSLVDAVAKGMQETGILVEQGIVLTSSTVLYRFNGLNAIKPEMLTDATDNAYEAAQSFATNAKTQLGVIRRATQGLFTIQDATRNYDSGNDVMKKVRIVTTVVFGLE